MHPSRSTPLRHVLTDPRAAAITLLVGWEKTRQPLAAPLESAGAAMGHAADRRLFVALVHGVLRRLRQLDRLLAVLVSRPLAGLDPLALAALRIGLFQLFFLDRIPPYAAVGQTVAALKHSGGPDWIAGFVNAVLRRALREKPTLLPGLDPLPADGHPEWLLERWRRRFGEDTLRAMCRSNDALPALVLATNSARGERLALLSSFAGQQIAAACGALSPAAIRLEGQGHSVAALPGYKEGLFWVQDESSQLATLLLRDAAKQGPLLDACAGVGGKTAALALMAVEPVTALEPDKGRAALFAANMERLRLGGRVLFERRKLEDFAADEKNHGRFAGIFLDAPCSGLGVLRRHPDIRWNRGPDDPAKFHDRQLALLTAAAPLLAPEGVLVYAVCSIEPEETVAVVEGFVRVHEHFFLENAGPLLPDAARHLVDVDGYFAPLPSADSDGFFAARLRRR